MGDAGLTGRKIIVDTYGGMARHGGGAFSGKDPSKVDRSAAYAMRWVAKNVVAAGLAKRAEIQIAYAIGLARPVGIYVETFGTETVDPARISAAIAEIFDLRPLAIIDALDLKRPIYAKTAAHGHFGREDPDFTWERLTAWTTSRPTSTPSPVRSRRAPGRICRCLVIGWTRPPPGRSEVAAVAADTPAQPALELPGALQPTLLQGFPASALPTGVPLARELPVARVLVESPLPHLDRPFDYAVPEALGAGRPARRAGQGQLRRPGPQRFPPGTHGGVRRRPHACAAGTKSCHRCRSSPRPSATW